MNQPPPLDTAPQRALSADERAVLGRVIDGILAAFDASDD